ncbi:hypothetical protein [Agrococcus sp. SGAir0287]|uniref:hypothetical protein n=1 Tax=Agrococcus sp. SGAir0287 TaxID=2070347 RepID=UPI0010CCFAE6|nr:hypothetical protein [Agrococcus sp. SGAir0287]QCR20164.1 hypothetical protein C1N71_12550 [Agrococcus sp. SGAir0287]
MARRIELENVADGMTGHFVRDAGWEQDWILGDLARAAVLSGSSTLRLDLEGSDRAATRDARILRADLQRHLARRRIPSEWVVGATLELWVLAVRGRRAQVRCRISIADDLGRVHASTRSTAVGLPRFGLVSRLARRLIPER